MKAANVRGKARRVEFPPAVRKALQQSVDGHCSVPRCKLPAMGPSGFGSRAVNLGVACHIYSAAKNGPRGQGGKSEEFIGSVANGIWCCVYHGSLIDKNEGGDYPAEVLLLWKDLAEARIRKRMNDIPSPLGWVESIEFTTFASRKSHLPMVKLSRFTLLHGENGSGKSTLMAAAASISNPTYARRFCGRVSVAGSARKPAAFAARTVYSTVDSVSRELFLEVEGDSIKRLQDGVSCIISPGDIEIVYCPERESIQNKLEDDKDFFMRVLSVDESALGALFERGATSLIPGTLRMGPASCWDDNEEEEVPRLKPSGEPYIEVELKFGGRTEFTSFAALSSSERDRLMLDLFVTKAREICKQRLTLLLVDGMANIFDEYNFEKLLLALEREDFQSLVTVPPRLRDKVIELAGGRLTIKDVAYLRPWQLAVLPPMS